MNNTSTDAEEIETPAEGLDQAVNKGKVKTYVVSEECYINGVRYHEGDKVTVPAKDKVPDYWNELK